MFMKSILSKLLSSSKIFSSNPEIFKVSFQVFQHYFKYRPFWTVVLIFSCTFGKFRSLITSYFTAVLIDSVVQNIRLGTADLQSIQVNIFLLLIINVFLDLNIRFYEYSSKITRVYGDFLFERTYYQKLNNFSLADLSDSKVADGISRIRDNIYNTQQLLNESIHILGGLIIACASAFIVVLNFPIIFPVIMVIAISKVIVISKVEIKRALWKEKQTSNRRVAQASSDYLVNSTNDRVEFNVGNLLSYFDQKYIGYIKKYIKTLLIFDKRNNFWLFIFDFLFSLTIASLFFFLLTEALSGQIGIGIVMFIASAIQSFIFQVGETSHRLTAFITLSKNVGYVFNLLDYKPKIKDGNKTYITKKNMAPSIKFENVSFKYPGSSKNVFTNLNLVIRSGEKIAIVGENGAGKSTLIKLIARAYQVSEGKVLVDDMDINSIKIDSWYRYLGILFQEFAFYKHLSVKENIYCGDTSRPINEKRIKESAKYADADEFINEYPNGYDEIMDPQFNGTTPSGGQKQKIAIARFFYRNAPLAIFDEPTSAIDAVSESKIFNRIYDFFKEKTVIIVSHRFSTVRNADRIIVVEHGEIIEEGTHQELLALDGSYARAYRLQAEGYQ